MRHLPIIIACFLLVSTGVAQTEPALVGIVWTAQQRPVSGVEVRIVGGGQDVTTDSGEFRIKLPATRIGQRLTLQVTKRGWEVSDPRDLLVTVPSDPLLFPIKITMKQISKPPVPNPPGRQTPATPPKCAGRSPSSATSLSVNARYHPSGIMGDIDDVTLSRYDNVDGFIYEAKGREPHEWDYKYINGEINPKPAQFAGVMYLDPPNNWGRESGFDLRGVRRVIKWEAHSLAGKVRVEFVIGGVVWEWDHEKKKQATVPCPDSMPRTSLGTKTLTADWQSFEWDISQLPEDAFRNVIGAFAWTISWGSNEVELNDAKTGALQPKTFKIELRNIRYEKGEVNELKDSRRSNRPAKKRKR